MTLKLKEGGYQELEQGIQEIESLTFGGLYSSQDMESMTSRLRQIAAEARKLRRALLDTALTVPDPRPAGGGKGAAA